jgi:hypothetical protein
MKRIYQAFTNSIGMCSLCLCFIVILPFVCNAAPIVYYANIGQPITLQCSGPYVCFSTYSFQNRMHQMVMLNNSRKYQITGGMVTINNVQATDAGFYACSSNCYQMRLDQINYYLQPMCKFKNNNN